MGLELFIFGSPQHWILCPALFAMYINECRSRHGGHRDHESVDDSVFVSSLKWADLYHGVVISDYKLVEFLDINASKTKETLESFCCLSCNYKYQPGFVVMHHL